MKRSSPGSQNARDCFLTSSRGESYNRTLEGRRFQFGETEAVEDESGAPRDDVGTIRLTCFFAKQADREPVGLNKEMSVDSNDAAGQVSEKHRIKQGKSLVARASGEKVLRHSLLPRHKSVEKRHVAEAGILIRVREKSWMRRQKLIDDEGRPCTHEMFCAMVAEEKAARCSVRREGAEEMPQGVTGSRASTLKKEQEYLPGVSQECVVSNKAQAVGTKADVVDEIVELYRRNERVVQDAVRIGDWLGSNLSVQDRSGPGSSQRAGRARSRKREAEVIEIVDAENCREAPRKMVRVSNSATTVRNVDGTPQAPRPRQPRLAAIDIVDLTVED